MEFWGVEVKAGEPLKVNPGEGRIIHLSQTSLGECKKDKGSETVPLFLKFDEQKLVLGTLSSVNFPQLSFDLVFEKEFELSHNWKNGSVFFCGYRAFNPEEGGFEGDSDESLTDSEEEEEDIPVISKENGGPLSTKGAPRVIPKSNAALKPVPIEKQVKLVDPSKDDEDEDEEDSSSDEDMLEGDSDDEDDESDDEDEETPKKVEPSKKRPSESATKTPVPAKKAKAASPQKTDGKKGGHTATPHPAKKLERLLPMIRRSRRLQNPVDNSLASPAARLLAQKLVSSHTQKQSTVPIRVDWALLLYVLDFLRWIT